MSEFKRAVASGMVMTMILALSFGWVATAYFPKQVLTSRTSEVVTFSEVNSTGINNSKTNVVTNVSSAFSSTSPCGSQGAYCGRASIESAKLTLNGNTSTLVITLYEVGNDYIGSATVYINGTVIGTAPSSQYAPPGNINLNVQANQSAILVLVIPTYLYGLHPGATYPVLVYAWLGVPGGPANSGLPETANVTAV